MGRDSKVAPAAHQPSKAELEEDVSIDATPEALAGAVTRGGAERRDPDHEGTDAPTQRRPNQFDLRGGTK